jgi:hypothetical protein
MEKIPEVEKFRDFTATMLDTKEKWEVFHTKDASTY